MPTQQKAPTGTYYSPGMPSYLQQHAICQT